LYGKRYCGVVSAADWKRLHGDITSSYNNEAKHLLSALSLLTPDKKLAIGALSTGVKTKKKKG